MAGSPQRKYLQSGQQGPTSISPEGFNPNGPYYKACCCHVKKFTVIFAIIEIFFVCFLIVAVIPDISSKMCGSRSSSSSFPDNNSTSSNSTLTPPTTKIPSLTGLSSTTNILNVTSNTPTIPMASSNQTRVKRQNLYNMTTLVTTRIPPSLISSPTVSPTINTNTSLVYRSNSTRNNETDDEISSGWYNDETDHNPPFKVLYALTCGMNMIWLLLALIHVISANLMFFGLKTTKWILFIPHITCRIMVILIIILMLILLITGSIFGNTIINIKIPIWVLSLIGLLFILPYSYVIYNEIKCAHFVKLSGETGFSLSNTRPVGQPTTSLSDGRPNNQGQGGQNIQMQQLNDANGTSENNSLPPLRHTFR